MYKPNDITYPLISWYKSNKRNLPWRNAFNHENAPYQILVSEFMLQQTTVATVLNYYDRFIERWPTNKDLSNATEDEVLEIWSGLGYYSRGINLLKTSKIIFHDYANKIPKNIDVSGTRFSLYIPYGDIKPRLLIPKDALIPSANKQIVYIFDKGLAKKKFIQSGASVGDKIEILNGLEEGQLVVVKGNENLRTNQEIKIKRKKK